MKDHEYYLGRQGKIFGPFSQKEFDDLLMSGKIEEYFWLWDGPSKSWKPLEAPPPAVQTGQIGEKQRPESRSRAPLSVVSEPLIEAKGFQVICHDFHHAVSGELERVTKSGCEFIAPLTQGGSPFGEQSQIFLNLYQEKSGHSIQVKAKLARVVHNQKGWRYIFKWTETPRIFDAIA